DLLAGGPRTAEDIAADAHLHAPSLRRLLRALCTFEIFAELPDGRFALTPLSQALRSDVPGSMRWLLALVGGGMHKRAWAELVHAIRTGETAVQHLYGMPAFEVLADDPEEAEIFNRAMTENTAHTAAGLVEAYDVSRFRTIVDVGGGHGLLLSEVLRAHPSAHGVLFDLPAVVAGAAPVLEAAGVADRCEVVGGSFFEDVPPGGDLYLLKSVIHDWDDEHAERILRTCCRRMAASSRVAVLDWVMPERVGTDETSRQVTLTDLTMLVVAGGRERTRAEFDNLFAAAGLAPTSVTPLPGGGSVIEAAPA
ncbi:MAG: methyltransferase, partial [Actinomycetota bacterium]